jgi:hypothetical protein
MILKMRARDQLQTKLPSLNKKRNWDTGKEIHMLFNSRRKIIDYRRICIADLQTITSDEILKFVNNYIHHGT